jgi:hypothetical protein
MKRRHDMKAMKTLALFGHGECGTTFFAGSNDANGLGYQGHCPNPSCNRKVALLPKAVFPSTDKARREYIRKAKHGNDAIFWQA